MFTPIRKLLYLLGLFFDKKSPWYIKAMLLCGFIYLLIPFDLITDQITLLGFLDDLGLLSIIAWGAYHFLPPELKRLFHSRFRKFK